MRTKGAALATACDWLFNYVVVQTTPIGIHYLHWGLYLVYAILNAAFVPIIYYFIVETAGKSLEQIDKWFALNQSWFVHKAGDVSYRDDESTTKEGKQDRPLGSEEEERERLVRGKGEEVAFHDGGNDHHVVGTEDFDDFVYDDDDLHSIGASESSEELYGRGGGVKEG